jgi:hypothetical protein
MIHGDWGCLPIDFVITAHVNVSFGVIHVSLVIRYVG